MLYEMNSYVTLQTGRQVHSSVFNECSLYVKTSYMETEEVEYVKTAIAYCKI